MATHAQQALFTQYFAQLILEAIRLGYEPVINDVARTKEQQALYVQQGKSQTQQSKHLERVAGDILLFRKGTYLTRTADYAALGRFWKSLDEHNVWGGEWETFPDGGHFEYTVVSTTRRVLQKRQGC